MHEMSLCEGVLRILEEQAREQQFARVKTVWLEIGDLSSVEKEAMRFSFDVVMKGWKLSRYRDKPGACNV
jgi:hydrogenase nickel incorporation protein HypA/HybF